MNPFLLPPPASGFRPIALLLAGLPPFRRSRAPGRTVFLALLGAALCSPALPLVRAQNTATLTSLYSFSGNDGNNPQAGLIQASDGNFYGTTEYGGTNGNGTIFRINSVGALTTLYSFTAPVAGTDTNTDGDYPEGGLVQGNDGNFYGTTSRGGANGYGTVFRITPAGGFTSLYSFTNGSDGIFPSAGLAQGSDGNFYGTTSEGGAYQGTDNGGAGTIFQITPAGVLTTLYSFGANGNPQSALVRGSDGNFYGTTAYGGGNGDGTVFQITPAGGFTTLHVFTAVGEESGSNSDGADPEDGLVQGSDGNFYGTTSEGGANGSGTVFQITPAGKLTSLYAFSAPNNNGIYPGGAYPAAGLVEGSDGNFYGTTSEGGASRAGTVFEITPTGVLTTLYSFTGGGDGGDPEGALVFGSDGNFYGTTLHGTSDDGTIFQLSLAPVITSAVTAAAPAGQPFSYQIAATNSPTSFAATGLPPGLSVDPASGLISGTPTQAGISAVSLSAANNFAAGPAATLTLTIIAPPVINSALTATAQAGVVFVYQIAATNSPTSFAATGLPAGLGIDASGVISGTPTTTGTFAIGLSAANAGGTATATLTLTVSAAPVPAPVITSAANASAQASVAFSYQITATNSPTDFAATGLPAGLSVDSSGVIAGTPTQTGFFSVALSASNAGGTGTATLNLTVAAAPLAPPAITSALAANAQQGQAFAYQITASSQVGSFTAAGLPAGLSVDPVAGLISGTPTQAGTFAVTLSAANSAGTGTATLSLVVALPGTPTHPAFFTGETALGNGVYYLTFPSGNYFGYYSYLTNPAYIYHFDLGYEYVFDAADGNAGVYLYDFASQDFFYTSPGFPFPYLYDFGLQSTVYYYPDPNDAGHYNTDGIRYFYVFNTGQIISK